MVTKEHDALRLRHQGVDVRDHGRAGGGKQDLVVGEVGDGVGDGERDGRHEGGCQDVRAAGLAGKRVVDV